MKIHVAIYYDVLGASLLQRGSFDVNTFNFKKDPLNEALKVIYKFYCEINRQFSEEIKITKAVYDEEYDVTEELNTYIKQKNPFS